jgi:hypothetical protein
MNNAAEGNWKHDYILQESTLNSTGRGLRPSTSDDIPLECLAFIERLKLFAASDLSQDADRSLELLSFSRILSGPIYRQHCWMRLPDLVA